MKRVFAHGLIGAATVFAVAFSTCCASAADASKLSGDWQLKIMTDDGQTLTPTLKLSQDNGKLKAIFAGVDGKDVTAEEVTTKGDDLSFKVTLDFQGTALVAKFALKQSGEALKGSVDYDLGGQTGTLDVSGARAGGTAPKLHEGTWNLEIVTEDGQTIKSSVKLTGQGDKLGGTFVGVDGTEVKVEEASLKNDELAFKVTVDFQGSPLVAKFKLKSAGEGSKGAVDYEIGGQTGTLDVVGKRPAAVSNSTAKALAGKWDYEVTGDDGQTTKAGVKLEVDGEKISGVVIMPDGKELKIEEPKWDGKELSFKVNVDLDGTALAATIKGTIEGNSINGQVDFNVGGQAGKLDLKGKRSENSP